MKIIKMAAVSAVLIMFFGCANSEAKKQEYVKVSGGDLVAFNSINSINIVIDPRIELLSIIQYLAGDLNSELGRNFDYSKVIDKYFSGFRNHEAVEFYKELLKNSFSYDAPPAFMLHLTYDINEDKSKEDENYTNYLVRRIGGNEKKERFIKLCRDFYEKTNFSRFYKENMSYYKERIKQYKETQNVKYVEIIEEFYGRKQKSYNSVLVAMYSGNNYATFIKTGNGGYDIYNIMSPTRFNSGTPLFENHVLFHEFSHSYITPLTEEYLEQLNKYAFLFEAIRDKMGAMAYGNWETCINEHIVRAVDIIVSEKAYGKEKTNIRIESEKANGFIYIEKIIEALRTYETKRKQYKTMDDYFPEIVKVFGGYAELSIDVKTRLKNVSGPINESFSNKGMITIILPTGEENKELEEEVRNQAKNIGVFLKKNLGKDYEIIDDDKVTDKEIEGSNIVIYGTVDGNKYLERIKDKLPFVVEKSMVKINGKEVKGENLRVISRNRNPVNSERSMLIYTGQKLINVLNINMVFHGPTAYVVAEDLSIREEGFYSN